MNICDIAASPVFSPVGFLTNVLFCFWIGMLGQEMIGKTLKMQHLEEDEEELVVSAEGRRKRTISSGDARPAWMRQLHTSVITWLKLVPQELKPLVRTLDNIKDPMFRCFEREVSPLLCRTDQCWNVTHVTLRYVTSRYGLLGTDVLVKMTQRNVTVGARHAFAQPRTSKSNADCQIHALF